MTKISVMGGFLQTAEILTNLCEHSNMPIWVRDETKSPENTSTTYAVIVSDALEPQHAEPEQADILIINKFKPSKLPKDFDLTTRLNGIVVLNSDDKNNFTLLRNNKAKLITYGFNSKAWVTASSVASGHYQTIQCCIQRSLPTRSGLVLEEQEFPVNVVDKDIYNVLGAITAGLLSGIDIHSLHPLVV